MFGCKRRFDSENSDILLFLVLVFLFRKQKIIKFEDIKTCYKSHSELYKRRNSKIKFYFKIIEPIAPTEATGYVPNCRRGRKKEKLSGKLHFERIWEEYLRVYLSNATFMFRPFFG